MTQASKCAKGRIDTDQHRQGGQNDALHLHTSMTLANMPAGGVQTLAAQSCAALVLTFALGLGSVAGRPRVEQVRLAEATDAADRRAALLEGREAAIPAAAHPPATILGAPGIFDLGPRRGCGHCCDGG